MDDSKHHYEIYFNINNMGWVMGAWRDTIAEAHSKGKKEVEASSDITAYKLKRKKNNPNTIVVGAFG